MFPMKTFLLGDELEDGKYLVDSLPGAIHLAIAAIEHHGNGSFLGHLRNSVPLKWEHAPRLFRGLEDSLTSMAATPMGQMRYPDIKVLANKVESCEPSAELWMIFQDCLFETPGVNDIFHEFFPDER